jgi:hypothetical protein
MKARHTLAALGAVLLAGPACAGPDDAAATLLWLEAAWLPQSLELQVRGTSGCGRFTRAAVSIAWNVDSSTVTLAIDPRRTITGTSCAQPAAFDTTLQLPIPRPSRQAFAIINNAANRLHIAADSRDSSIARWFGGRANVVVPSGCRFLQLSQGYAFDSIPGVSFTSGTRLFVRGSLPVTPEPGCDTEPHATLSHYELVPSNVRP